MTRIDTDLLGRLSAVIRVSSVIRVPLMRSLLRTPIAEPNKQLMTDPVSTFYQFCDICVSVVKAVAFHNTKHKATVDQWAFLPSR
jgi:hypothetical protein